MLSCLREWNAVRAASILFSWMQSVHLICLRFVLTQWIIIAPWKPAHHESTGLTYPQIHFCNNPPLLPWARHAEQANKHIHACVHAATCWHGDLSVDMTQSSIRWFYAIWHILMYFVEFKCAAYRENSRGSHWLVADGEDSHFMLIFSAGMTSEIDDFKHEYTSHILMFFGQKINLKKSMVTKIWGSYFTQIHFVQSGGEKLVLFKSWWTWWRQGHKIK